MERAMEVHHKPQPLLSSNCDADCWALKVTHLHVALVGCIDQLPGWGIFVIPRLGVVITRWGLCLDTCHSLHQQHPQWFTVRLSAIGQGRPTGFLQQEGEGSGDLIDLKVNNCQCSRWSETWFANFLSRTPPPNLLHALFFFGNALYANMRRTKAR